MRFATSAARQPSEHPAPPDVFESALSDLTAPTPPPPAESSATPPPAPVSPPTFYRLTDVTSEAIPADDAHSPVVPDANQSRHAFIAAFDRARRDRARPFLALAVRFTDAERAPTWFPTVDRAIRTLAGDASSVVADGHHFRLAALLPGEEAGAARRIFSDLMLHLREHLPDADDVAQHIRVLAAPQGAPYVNGRAFATTALDGP